VKYRVYIPVVGTDCRSDTIPALIADLLNKPQYVEAGEEERRQILAHSVPRWEDLAAQFQCPMPDVDTSSGWDYLVSLGEAGLILFYQRREGDEDPGGGR
jgi:hypothetical protein